MKRLIPIALLAMVIMVGMASCNNDTESSSPRPLSGTVTLPGFAIIGQPVTATTTLVNATDSNALFQWYSGSTLVAAGTGLVTLPGTDTASFTQGDTLFVRVSRNEGEITSLPSTFINAVVVSSIVIEPTFGYDPAAGVQPGSYKFNVVVESNADPSDAWYNWSREADLSVNAAASTITGALESGVYVGTLSVLASQAGSTITITAQAKADPSQSATFPVKVAGSAPSGPVIKPTIAFFEVRDTAPTGQPAVGTMLPVQGGMEGRTIVYRVANQIVPDGANGRSEIYFYFDRQYDVQNEYKWASFEMKPSPSMQYTLSGFYPRVRPEVVTGTPGALTSGEGNHVQFYCNEILNDAKNYAWAGALYAESTGGWATFIIPLNGVSLGGTSQDAYGAFHGGTEANVGRVLANVGTLALRFITDGKTTNGPGEELFFTDITLYRNWSDVPWDERYMPRPTFVTP